MEVKECPFIFGLPVLYRFDFSTNSRAQWIPGRIVNLDWMCSLGRIEEGSKVKTDLEAQLSKNGNQNFLLVESLDDLNFIVRNWTTQIKEWARTGNSSQRIKKSKKIQLATLRADRLLDLFQLSRDANLPFQNLSNLLAHIYSIDSKEDIMKQISNLEISKVEDIIARHSIFCDSNNYRLDNELYTGTQELIRSNCINTEKVFLIPIEIRWKKLVVSLITYCSEIVDLLEVLPQDMLFNYFYSICPNPPALPKTNLESFILISHPLCEQYLQVANLYLDILSRNLVFLIKDNFDQETENTNPNQEIQLPNYIKAVHTANRNGSEQMLGKKGHIICFSLGYKFGRTNRYTTWDMIPHMGYNFLPPEHSYDQNLIKYTKTDEIIKLNNKDFSDTTNSYFKAIDTLNRLWYLPEQQCINLELIFITKPNSIFQTTIHSIEEQKLSHLSTILNAHRELKSTISIEELENRLVAKGMLYQVQKALKGLSPLFF